MIAGRNRAGWFGVAAALAFVAQSPAQMQHLTQKPAAKTSARATAADTARPFDAIARLSEIKVAIAWMADPATFTTPLKAHAIRGGMLEISGTVANAQERARVLEIAQRNSELSIVDALKVHATRTAKPRPDSPARMNVEATNALMEPAFRSIRDLEVQVHPEGQVVLLGSIASYEEKFNASQRVARVAGCTSVDNRLDVRSVTINERPVCPVTADGKMLVPAPARTATSTIIPAAHVTAADKSIKPSTTTAAPPPGNTRAKTAAPAKAGVTKATPGPLIVPHLSKDLKPAITVVPAAASTAKPGVDPAVTRAVFEAKTSPAFVVTPVKPATPEAPATIVPVGAGTVALAAPAPSVSASVQSLPVSSEHAKPAAADPDSESTWDPTSASDWYRRRVAEECGLDPSSVTVAFPSRTDMIVTLSIPDRATAGQLCTKVSRIAELGPYHVRIEVKTPAGPLFEVNWQKTQLLRQVK